MEELYTDRLTVFSPMGQGACNNIVRDQVTPEELQPD